MNFDKMQKDVVAIIKKVGYAAFEQIATEAAKAILREAKTGVEEITDETDDTPAALLAPKKKKPVVTEEEAEGAEDAETVEEVVEEPVASAPGTKNRATDTEMVVKLTALLNDLKTKKAPKEKIAECQAKLTKYADKVKAAGKILPKAPAAPAKAAAPVAAPAKASGFAKKAPAAPVKETAKATEAVWNGKCGIIPIKVGSAVLITDATAFSTVDDEGVVHAQPMKYRVVEIDAAEGKVKVFPAELGGEPSVEGQLPMTEEESNFSAGWLTIAADGSNIKTVKKVTKEAV